MTNLIIKKALSVLLIVVILGVQSSTGQAQTGLQQEIVVKVQPNIIAMPANQAEKAPIGYVRVRSTDLRDLNEIYAAKTIEKVFEFKQVGNRQPERIELADTFIISFALEAGINVQDLISDYEELSVVLDAQEK